VLLGYLIQDGFLLFLFFDPEDGGDMFFRNVDLFLTDYMVVGIAANYWLDDRGIRV
jgi:hypothetical protein